MQRTALLWRGPRIVGNDLVTLYGQFQLDFDRPAANTIIVVILCELGLTIGQFPDTISHQSFRIINQRPHVPFQFVDAISLDELQYFCLAGDEGGYLGAHIAQDFVRNAGVMLD